MLLINKVIIKYFNSIYNHSNDFFVEVFVRLIRQPNFDYKWFILLKNKKKVIVNVRKDNPRSYEYSLSYKWHDRPLRDIEILLNDYYPKNFYYLDIGANYGLRSIYALSVGRPVVLFEPNSEINDFTLEIFKKNGFNNYKLENLCLSDRPGEMEFYISGNTYESSLHKIDNAVKKINVNCTTIDNYISSLNYELIPKIVKIDVEGAEFEVINGGINTITRHKPSLIIEILQDSTTGLQLLELLFSQGYHCVALKNGLFHNFIRLSDSNRQIMQYCTNYFFTTEQEILKMIKCGTD